MEATLSLFRADTQHSFVRPFNPKESPMIEGYRNSVIRYRDTTKGVAVKPAKTVTIPAVILDANTYLLPDDAQKVLIGILEDQQDTLIRNAIDNGANVIDWSQVTVDSCLAALTAVRISQRLNKEQVEFWAKVALADFFKHRANEISTNSAHSDVQKVAQLAMTTNAYVSELCKLTAPVPAISEQKATMLKNALILSKVNDDISNALLAKIKAILNPKIDNLDGL